MKMLKIPALICLFVAIATANASSQPVRTQNQVYVAFILKCNDDMIMTVLGYEKILHSSQNPAKDNKIQIRLNDVTVKGRANFAYDLSFNPVILTEGGDQSASTMTIKFEGKLLTRIPVLILATPEGQVLFDINPLDATCF